MKAWIVRDKYGDSGSAIVFAETRGKAHAYAMFMDNYEDYEWTDIEVHRFKAWDSHYKGHTEADWNEDRLELVRDYGWHCLEPYYEECKDCEAKQYCSEYDPGDYPDIIPYQFDNMTGAMNL